MRRFRRKSKAAALPPAKSSEKQTARVRALFFKYAFLLGVLEQRWIDDAADLLVAVESFGQPLRVLAGARHTQRDGRAGGC